MKKLLKSEIYGYMNSARMHCSRKTESNVTAESKKKKKGKTRKVKRTATFSALQTGTELKKKIKTIRMKMKIC